MRHSVFIAFLLLAVPIFEGQATQSSEITLTPEPFNAIVEQLRKAKASTSPHKRQRALITAESLVKALPPSRITEQLKFRLGRAFKAGVMTDESERLIDEAIEIAGAASKLLKRRPSTYDPELARATLLRVLNSPEFRIHSWFAALVEQISKWLEKPVSRLISWIARILTPIFKWVGKLLEVLGAWFWYWFKFLMEVSPFLAWGTVGLLGAMVSASLAYMVWKKWLKLRKETTERVVAQALVMPEQLLKEAENAARKGDYLTAVRKAYRALLLTLDHIGLIRFREQRTNWEYLAEVSRKAPMEFVSRFREASSIFDRCFYARKLATANEFIVVKRLAEETRHYARSLHGTSQTPWGVNESRET